MIFAESYARPLLLLHTVLAAALYALGVWIVLQPMEMRGMVMT